MVFHRLQYRPWIQQQAQMKFQDLMIPVLQNLLSAIPLKTQQCLQKPFPGRVYLQSLELSAQSM